MMDYKKLTIEATNKSELDAINIKYAQQVLTNLRKWGADIEREFGGRNLAGHWGAPERLIFKGWYIGAFKSPPSCSLPEDIAHIPRWILRLRHNIDRPFYRGRHFVYVIELMEFSSWDDELDCICLVYRGHIIHTGRPI